MKKLSKSGLLFGAVLVVCASMASMASAASFFQVGTTHQLTSNDLQFTVSGPPQLGSSCATSQFDADVVSASVVEITAARFQNCTGTFFAAGCTVTPTATRLPWTATAPNTTNIQIHGVHIDVAFSAPATCPVLGLTTTLTGTLSNGVWDASSVGANRRVTFRFPTGTGLTSHVTGSPDQSALVNGEIRDPAGTFNIFD